MRKSEILEGFKIEARFEESVDCLCKKCGELQSSCRCKEKEILKNRGDYFLRINEEKASGRDVTRCGVFYEDFQTMQNFLNHIKKQCASGGGLEIKEGGIWLFVQGKHREFLKQFFKTNHFRFKH